MWLQNLIFDNRVGGVKKIIKRENNFVTFRQTIINNNGLMIWFVFF